MARRPRGLHRAVLAASQHDHHCRSGTGAASRTRQIRCIRLRRTTIKGVESGQGTLGSLRDMLNSADSRVFIRMAVDKGAQAARYLDATAAPSPGPPDWDPAVWEYEAVTFIADQVPSQALAAALDPGGTRVLSAGGFTVTLPGLSGQLSWQHRPGRARHDPAGLPWPSFSYDLQSQGGPGDWQWLHGYLIGDDCPSFPSYEAAFRAFFYRDFSRLSHGQVPSGFGTVRVAESRAWFDTIRISPVALDVRLGGRALDGARVELNSETYQCDARATATGRVTLPLPDGLPPGAWLYLSRDRQWLDYRALGDCTEIADFARAGVEVEVPDDPGSEIQALLARGEGLQVEFKRQLPESSVESKRTVFKTVAAFANGYGGSIVFGVESDEATICGLDVTDPIAARDRLAQLARAIVTPAPEAEARSYEHDGKALLVLSVSRGTSPPYGITLPGREGKPVEFYVRRDATTFAARPDEIRNAVLAAVPPPAAGPSWGAS